MPQELNKFKKWLLKIQRQNHQEKRKWLIALTTLLMVLILIMWYFYLTKIVMPATSLRKVTENNKEISKFEVFNKGLEEIFKEAKEQLQISKQILEEQAKKKKELIIEKEASSSQPQKDSNNHQ